MHKELVQAIREASGTPDTQVGGYLKVLIERFGLIESASCRCSPSPKRNEAATTSRTISSAAGGGRWPTVSAIASRPLEELELARPSRIALVAIFPVTFRRGRGEDELAAERLAEQLVTGHHERRPGPGPVCGLTSCHQNDDATSRPHQTRSRSGGCDVRCDPSTKTHFLGMGELGINAGRPARGDRNAMPRYDRDPANAASVDATDAIKGSAPCASVTRKPECRHFDCALRSGPADRANPSSDIPQRAEVCQTCGARG